MSIPTRTPEGERNSCPVCGHTVVLEPSRPPGDAPCPYCGTLLWFVLDPVPRVETLWQHAAAMLDQGNVEALWQQVVAMVEKGNTDVGLAILQNVVVHHPDDVGKRRALREIERRVHSRREARESLVLIEVESEICQLKRGRSATLIEWDLVDRAAERGLSVDPWNLDLHVELGHACKARGYHDAARFAYGCALEVATNRDEIERYLAELPCSGGTDDSAK